MKLINREKEEEKVFRLEGRQSPNRTNQTACRRHEWTVDDPEDRMKTIPEHPMGS